MAERTADTGKVGFLSEIALGVPVTVALEALRPEQLLRSLSDLPAPVRLSVTGRQGRANVDLGNGLLMGAEATRPGAMDGPLEGLDALRFFLAMEHGEARIAPRRFLELANVVRSVDQALATAFSAEAPPSEDARVSPSVTPLPPPVREPDGEPEPEEVRAAPASRPTAPRRRPQAVRRRWTTWALAAACLIAFAVGAIAGLLVEPAPPSVDDARGERKVEATKVLVRVVERVPDPRVTADGYARRARRMIREGRRVEALTLAELAVGMRPGRADLQRVLGDARYANGQRVAARRAWRRAIALDPGDRQERARLRRLERIARRSQGIARPS